MSYVQRQPGWTLVDGVSFVPVTQSFSTADAMGRLTLFTSILPSAPCSR